MRYVRWVLSLAVVAFLPVAGRAQPRVNHDTTTVRRAGYAGSAACVECHKKTAAQFTASTMGQVMLGKPRDDHEALGCEGCHGPGKQHAESGGEERGALVSFSRKSPTPVADRNAQCLSCHEKTARTLWKGSTHESRNVACTDCHTVMHTNTERGNLKGASVVATCGNCHKDKQAQIAKFSHMPLGEGKLECSSCHNPHGSPNEKMLVASSANETCYSCHAEKRGPFLWEHMPVTENCSNCHDPHGSNKEKMLKVARPRLCQQCHPTAHGGTTARPSDLATSRFVYNRSCQNCHFNIHGSNHPAGAFFTR